jgi:hypothetical protein
MANWSGCSWQVIELCSRRRTAVNGDVRGIFRDEIDPAMRLYP